MELRILGPLEVLDDDGVPVDVGGSRPRTLLIDLALAQGHPVPADQLLEDVWNGERIPARNNLQVHVSAAIRLASLGFGVCCRNVGPASCCTPGMRSPLPDVLEELVGRHRVPLGQREIDEQRARTTSRRASTAATSSSSTSSGPRIRSSTAFHRRARLSAICKPPYRRRPTRLTVCPTTRSPPTNSPSWRGRPGCATTSPTRRGWRTARIGRRGVSARVATDRKPRWCASRLPASLGKATSLASERGAEFPHDDLVRQVKDTSK